MASDGLSALQEQFLTNLAYCSVLSKTSDWTVRRRRLQTHGGRDGAIISGFAELHTFLRPLQEQGYIAMRLVAAETDDGLPRVDGIRLLHRALDMVASEALSVPYSPSEWVGFPAKTDKDLARLINVMQRITLNYVYQEFAPKRRSVQLVPDHGFETNYNQLSKLIAAELAARNLPNPNPHVTSNDMALAILKLRPRTFSNRLRLVFEMYQPLEQLLDPWPAMPIESPGDVLDPEPPTLPDPDPPKEPPMPALDGKHRIFLVHGHDTGPLNEVQILLMKLKLEVVVLKDKAGTGLALMELLEKYGDVDYAIVLLTGDDRGGPKSQTFEEQKPRARQNAVLELGYFMGRLGRDKVCAMYEPGVEMPSDYAGVKYIGLNQGDWQIQLARELEAAGLKFDFDDVL